MRRYRETIATARGGVLPFVVLVSGALGCGDDGRGGHSGTDGTGGGACVEPRIEPPPASNSNYRGIVSGDGRGDNTLVAVGYVDEVASANSCCQDYILASENPPTVHVRFGVDPKGLGFQEPLGEDVPIPSDADDILLHDVNADDRNERYDRELWIGDLAEGVKKAA